MDKYLNILSDFFSNQTYVKALGIAVLFFLLLIAFAALKRYMNKSTLQGIVVGVFLGVLLTLIVEGFFLIAGKTALTELLGWKDPPKPVQTALDIGKDKLVGVLGVTDEIQSSYASKEASLEEGLSVIQSMNPEQILKLKAIICTP